MTDDVSRSPQCLIAEAVVRYAKKKNIPLATAILSGYIDELNRHPEICVPSDRREIFGRPRKRKGVLTARQFAEIALTCTRIGPVEECSGYHHNFLFRFGKNRETRKYYSIGDLRGFERNPEDVSAIDWMKDWSVVNPFEWILPGARPYEAVEGFESPFGEKDLPFSMNLLEVDKRRPKGGAWDGCWEEVFFAYRGKNGMLEVSRHLPSEYLKNPPSSRFFLYN